MDEPCSQPLLNSSDNSVRFLWNSLPSVPTGRGPAGFSTRLFLMGMFYRCRALVEGRVSGWFSLLCLHPHMHPGTPAPGKGMAAPLPQGSWGGSRGDAPGKISTHEPVVGGEGADHPQHGGGQGGGAKERRGGGVNHSSGFHTPPRREQSPANPVRLAGRQSTHVSSCRAPGQPVPSLRKSQDVRWTQSASSPLCALSLHLSPAVGHAASSLTSWTPILPTDAHPSHGRWVHLSKVPCSPNLSLGAQWLSVTFPNKGECSAQRPPPNLALEHIFIFGPRSYVCDPSEPCTPWGALCLARALRFCFPG